MNERLIRLARLTAGLLVALVVATTYWQTWARPGLAARQDNEVRRVEEFQVRRGAIVAGGRTLARNISERSDGRVFFLRRYPQHGLAAHVVGYSTIARSRAGLEQSRNGVLTGTERGLSGLVESNLDALDGEPVAGDALVLSLDPKAQEAALAGLGSRCGAVVVLDPRTGRVRVMVSTPTFDPELVEERFAEIAAIEADCEPGAPLLNRATAGLYAPGSTFKVVTAAAALESGDFTPASQFVDPGFCLVYGKRVSNFDTSRPFGKITLARALQHSVNSVFCEIGKTLGAKAILDQARRFGFYGLPPLETPAGERAVSGLYRDGAPWRPKGDPDVDAGRLAFGQERMLVTPLQMAMVAGAIGAGGTVMRPSVIDRVISRRGTTRRATAPSELGRAISPETAQAVAQMMVNAVESGTGTAARISGYRIGGKTGTAETGVPGRNTVWFVAFAGEPGAPPEAAIAVVVEAQASTGGSTAAPIARAVLEALLTPG
ncbi:MAG: penicillin-binding protein 2 [Thermoleophilia bacterium]|nr:penicillin-binding protein 2 [Thermoleophilia bacterium]